MAVTLKGYTPDYLGSSTDAKPTEADVNAKFRELDTNKKYYFTGAAWVEIPSSGGGGGVTSVNSKTGAVVLDAEDVGALPDSTEVPTVIETTCTLTVAGWTGADVPYTQTVNVTGILATDVAICDVSVSSTVATGVDEMDDWELISKIESGAGTLTFSCYEDKPITELNVNVKVVR